MARRYAAWSIELARSSMGGFHRFVRLHSPERNLLVPSRPAFEPPADVYVTDDAVVVRLEIAGVGADLKAISVEIADNILTVSGVRPDPAAGSVRKYEQIEIQTGRFLRVLELPCPVDETAAAAKYEDGFLVVFLPRRVATRTGAYVVAIE